MTFLDTLNHRLLNSATKYPKIPTYHALVDKGILTENPAVFPPGDVILTEKVDGTNARVIVDEDGDIFIGSREELLYAFGDRVINPIESIVPNLRTLSPYFPVPETGLAVYFLEVFGGGVGDQWKQYTNQPDQFGVRLFDAAFIPPEILDDPIERISSWRKNGGQKFANEKRLADIANQSGINLTPRLGVVPSEDLPATVNGMHQFLKAWTPKTNLLLSPGGKGNPEGIVARTPDRSHVVKIRHKDYDRTAAKRAQARNKAA